MRSSLLAEDVERNGSGYANSLVDRFPLLVVWVRGVGLQRAFIFHFHAHATFANPQNHVAGGPFRAGPELLADLHSRVELIQRRPQLSVPHAADARYFRW